MQENIILYSLFIIILLLQDIIQANNYNYRQKGDDWTGTCSSGSKQSPIDIVLEKSKCEETIKPYMKMQNEVVSVPIVYPLSHQSIKATMHFSDIQIIIGEEVKAEYNAVDFIIHSPSEHTIDGKFFDVELHIVHEISQPVDGYKQKAIVGLFFDKNIIPETEDQTFFHSSRFDISRIKSQPLSLNATKIFGESEDNKDKENIYDRKGQFFTYDGSLTSPPCTEEVTYYLTITPLPILESQLDIIKGYFQDDPNFADGEGNNRRVQDINDRVVKVINQPCLSLVPPEESIEPDPYKSSQILIFKILIMLPLVIFIFI